MSTILKAVARQASGKGGARKQRLAGFVPGIVYGAVKQPTAINVNAKELTALLATEGETGLIDLTVEDGKGKKVASEKAVIRHVDFDPRKDTPIHIDFLAVAMDKKLTISVPVELVGTPIGVTVNKGLMSQVGYEIGIECLPGAIPHSIKVDVSNLDIGDSLHVGDLPAMEGIRFVTSKEQTLVTVEAPKVEEVAAPAAEAEEAPAEPEVITKRKTEEEEGQAS